MTLMKNNVLKRVVGIILAATFVITAFAGCSKATDENKAFAYPVAEDPECLDPQIASTSSALTVIANCMEGLVRYDAQGNIVNAVAQSYTVSPDGLTYVFKLSDKSRWYTFDTIDELLGKDFDKTVTANDFVFALQRAVKKETNCPTVKNFFVIKNAQAVNSGTKPISELGVRATDNFTLEISLEFADAPLLDVLTTAPAMPCSEKFFNATKGGYGLDIDRFMCNGPFYASRWNEDASFLIKKNSEYGGNTPAVPASVNFYVDSDESSIADKIKDVTYDAGVLSSTNAESLIKNDKISYSEFENTVWGLCFNTVKGNLSNINLRLALSVAAYASKVKDEFLLPADGIVPNMCRAGAAGYRAHAGAVTGLSANSAKAQEYWSKALDELGVKNIELTLICTPEHKDAIQKVLIQSWQKYFGLSVKVNLQLVESTKISAQLARGDYEVIFAPLVANGTDAAEFLSDFPAKAAYSSTAYADLTQKAMNTAGDSETVAACYAAENYLIQNAVFIPVCFEHTYFVMAENVSGIYLSSLNALPCFIDARRAGKK